MREELPPPSWADMHPMLAWASILFLITGALCIEHYLMQKYGKMVQDFGTSFLGIHQYRGRRGFMNRAGSSLRVFKSNIAYLKLVQPIVFKVSAVVKAVICIVISYLYVYCTYLKHVPQMICDFQRAVGGLFCVLHIFEMWADDSSIGVLLSFRNIFECMAIASLLQSSEKLWLNLNFLSAFSILTSAEKISKLHQFEQSASFRISRKISQLVIESLVFMYIVASGLQFFEVIEDPNNAIESSTFSLTFVNSLYFATVTALTVGYGDFVPRSTLGRFWVIGIVFFGAYMVSVSVGQSVAAISEARRGHGKYMKVPGTKHVVVCGSVQWEYLKHFVLEFFAEESNRETCIVVIAQDVNWTKELWSAFKTTLTVPTKYLTYLHGSTQTHDGLVRAEVGTAEAVFVLARPHIRDPQQEDSEVTKHVLAIRNHNHSVKIYAICILRDTLCAIEEVIEPEHITNQRRDRVEALLKDGSSSIMPTMDGLVSNQHLLCMQNIESLFVAENVFCNGLSTLILNAMSRIHPTFHEDDRPWLHEYKLGAECEFHSASIPENMDGHLYEEIAIPLYDMGLVLVAIRSGWGEWENCENKTRIGMGMHGMFLSYHDEDVVEELLEELASAMSPVPLQLSRSRGLYKLSNNEPVKRQSKVEKRKIPRPKKPKAKSQIDPISPSILTREIQIAEEDHSLSGSGYSSDESTLAMLEGSSSNLGSPSVVGKRSHAEKRALVAKQRRSRNRNYSLDEMPDLNRSTSALQTGPYPQRPQKVDETPFQVHHGALPVHLHRHLVLCLQGRVSLLHVEMFLERLWRKRSGHKRKMPVVAIHKSFPADFEQEMSRYRNDLYLLEGSSQSLYTLQKAQYKNASSVVILAMEEWKSQETLDAKALFAVMTLDNLLPDNSPIYVCTAVDAEDSIQLLRPPGKARRIGVQLGEILHPMMLMKRKSMKPAADEVVKDEELQSESSQSVVGSRNRSFWMKNPGNMSIMDNISNNAKRLFTVNLSEKLQGTSSARKRESSRNPKKVAMRRNVKVQERQRFASGEIFINTHLLAMMIRDYSLPGFMDYFLSKLVIEAGHARFESNLWWRLVDLPKDWFGDPDETRTYREALIKLRAVNCTAMGIYRSGDSPVRLREEDQGSGRHSEGGFRIQNTGVLLNLGGGPRDNRRNANRSSGNWRLDTEMSQLLGTPLGYKVYRCPTTNRELHFNEITDGENMLPYVYTNPEPYTALSSTDAIFVSCHPDLEIPADWYSRETYARPRR